MELNSYKKDSYYLRWFYWISLDSMCDLVVLKNTGRQRKVTCQTFDFNGWLTTSCWILKIQNNIWLVQQNTSMAIIPVFREEMLNRKKSGQMTSSHQALWALSNFTLSPGKLRSKILVVLISSGGWAGPAPLCPYCGFHEHCVPGDNQEC